MPFLLAATPTFASAWASYSADPGYEADLLYPHPGELARHLLVLDQRGDRPALSAVFAVIERLHGEGDADVREAATIGLLESLQNNAEHAGIDPNRFVPYLGAESLTGWEALNRFWFGQPTHPGLGE
jgi:hypothetical protein